VIDFGEKQLNPHNDLRAAILKNFKAVKTKTDRSEKGLDNESLPQIVQGAGVNKTGGRSANYLGKKILPQSERRMPVRQKRHEVDTEHTFLRQLRDKKKMNSAQS
jgi:hypothetical protein